MSSHRFFQEITENSLSGVYVLQNGLVRYANRAMASIFGYTPEEMIDRLMIPQIIFAEDWSMVQRNIQARLSGEVDRLHYIFRGVRKDGGVIYCEALGYFIEYEGAPAIAGTLLDVTERVRAEAALRDSEARYRALFHEHQAIKLLIDPNSGRIVDANPAARDFYGYNDLIGMRISDLNALSVDEVAQAMRNAQTRQRNFFVFPHKLSSGEIRQVEVRSVPIHLNEGPHLYSIIHDVTDRLHTEREIKRRTEEIEKLHTASRKLNQSLDLDTIHETAYEMICAMMDCDSVIISRYTPEDNLIRCLYARHDGEVMPVSELPPLALPASGSKGTQAIAIHTGESMLLLDYQHYLRHGSEGYYYDEEHGLVDIDEPMPEDEELPQSALIVPMPLKGAIVGVIQVMSYRKHAYTDDHLRFLEALALPVAIATNNAILYQEAQNEIRERERAEAALCESEEARLKAERLRVEMEKDRELVELRERFIAIMSHELRNPLSAIMSSSSLVQEYHDRLTPMQRNHHLENIQSKVRYMVSMIEDLLNISRAQAGKVAFQPVTMHLGTFCQSLVAQIQATTRIHHLLLTTRGDLTAVNADEKLLTHILYNLLTNAVKYSPNGGGVFLEVVAEPGHIVLTVRDSGIGIPEDEIDNLFEPFYRASNTGSIEGTGLGLSIVRDSVTLHGGTIQVFSREGTTFVVRLPV